MVFEIAAIVSTAVYNAFINDVVPRPVLGRFYGFFRAISLLAGILFNLTLFGVTERLYPAIFIGVAVLLAVGFTGMCLRVTEGEYPPPEPVADPSPVTAVAAYCRACFSNPYYVWVSAAIALPTVATVPINLFNLYFAHSVGVTDGQFGKLTALYFALGVAQAVPLGWLVDRYHPLRVSAAVLVLHAAAAAWGAAYIRGGGTFAVAFVLTGTLSGTWMTASASFGQRLFSQMKFAQMASAMWVVICVSVIGLGPVAGRFLAPATRAGPGSACTAARPGGSGCRSSRSPPCSRWAT